MIFAANGLRLVLSETAREQMQQHRQLKHADPEAGGVMLGRILLDGADVIVDGITRPTTRDRASRFNFFRNKTSAQPAVDHAWTVSEGTCIYLGEWHTHPEDDPHPSRQDLANWGTILRKARFEQPWLFFVIVGRTLTKAWIGNREKAEIVLLPASTTGSPL